MKNERWLFQHKFTEKASHAVKLDDLKTLEDNAVDEDLDPCYMIDFNGKEYCLIPRHKFDEFDEYLKNV